MLCCTPSSSPAAQSADSGNLVTTTVKDYDLGEVSKGVKGVYTGLAMMYVDSSP